MTLATLLVLSIGVGGWALLAPQSSEYMSRYLLSDEGWNVDEGSLARQGAISPDGSTWILPVDGEEDSRLAFKARGTTDLTPIAGTEGAHGVAVSPDGEWILFGQGTNLVKRPLVGGTAEILAEDTEQPIYTFALAWLDDGTILYEDFGAGPMRRIRHLSEDGQPLSLFLDDGHGFSAAWISGLPGARGALVTGCAGSGGCQPDENDLFLLALDDASFVPLVEQVVRAWYVPTGHIVYVQADGAVFAVPFDVGSMEVTGQPTPLLEGVRIAAVAADMVLGADGTALYWEGAAIGRGQAPVWVARDGSQQVLDTLLSGEFGAPAVSPDGRMVAFEYQVLSEENPGIDIWVYSIDAGTFNRITVEGQSNRHPFWSPDGLAIAFSSGRNGLVALYSRPIDLSSPSRVLAADPEGDMWEGAWTADGRSLVYRRGEGDIVVRPASPDSKAELIAATEARERNPAVSRDGSWLAYVSDESGRDEVYVRPLAARGGRAQISVAGGRGPVWSAAGEVLYSSGDALISATIREEPELAFERREQLLDLRPYVQRETHPYFDVSADGERLLSISRGDGSEQRALGTEDRLVVIENFFLQLEPALVQD